MNIKFMCNKLVISFSLVLLVLPGMISADGVYSILQDDSGVYFYTENDGEWYIDDIDLPSFRVGQTGCYQIGEDANGRYIEAMDKKFYLGTVDDDFYRGFESEKAYRQASMKRSSTSPIMLIGPHVIVPVKIKYGNQRLELNLLLDTGATFITLYRNALKSIPVKSRQAVRFRTANGESIAGKLVRLDEVRFGPFVKKGILAGVIDNHEGMVDHYDGLLGMNVLSDLNYKIDSKNKRIFWNIKP